MDLWICLSCFFFSSRRRHTRSKRDWSSDVCSSDLVRCAELLAITVPAAGDYLIETNGLRRNVIAARADIADEFFSRSEERRVGKECRFRRGGGYCKMK